MRAGKLFLPILLGGLTLGCAGYTRHPVPTSTPPAYQQFQVWTPDSVLLLRRIRVEHDTLYGIPTGEPADCSRCERKVHLSAVDSVRTGGSAGSSVTAALLGAVGGAVVMLLLIASSIPED